MESKEERLLRAIFGNEPQAKAIPQAELVNEVSNHGIFDNLI